MVTVLLMVIGTIAYMYTLLRNITVFKKPVGKEYDMFVEALRAHLDPKAEHFKHTELLRCNVTVEHECE